MTTIDTNYILRFLTRDVEDQYLVAKKFITDKNVQKHVSPIIIAETVYILQNHYEIDKNRAIGVIRDFLSIKHIESLDYIKAALQIYEKESISFYDSLIIAQSIVENKSFKTFDLKLKKYLQNINRIIKVLGDIKVLMVF